MPACWSTTAGTSSGPRIWQNERSENAIGLEHRWIIKGVFYLGLWLLLAGVVSVMLRLIVFLFGRRPQSEVELQIGHAELEV